MGYAMNTFSKAFFCPRGSALPQNNLRWSVLLLCAILSGTAFAHAFPQKSEPPVGATLTSPPRAVKIWFDDEIRPGVSKLTVKDSAGHVVSQNPAKVAGGNLLEVSLHPLPAGTYHVYWSVTSKDGHHTQGDYEFTVESAQPREARKASMSRRLSAPSTTASRRSSGKSAGRDSQAILIASGKVSATSSSARSTISLGNPARAAV